MKFLFKMEENRKDGLFNDKYLGFYCCKNKAAVLVCSEQSCLQYPFICSQPQCYCISASHQTCKTASLSSIIKGIQVQYQTKDDKAQQILSTIQKFYEQCVDKLSKLRLQFLNTVNFFGLKPNSSRFLELVTNQQINLITGKMISDIQQEIQNCIQQKFLYDQEQILTFLSKKQEQFQQFYQQLKPISNSSLYWKCLNSNIINCQQRQQLSQFFEERINGLQLLYSAKHNQFDAGEFHSNCDGKNDTVTILRTQFGKIIGGYTPAQWESTYSSKKVSDSSKRSFLFSLSLNEKYTLRDQNNAIENHKNYGPIFGSGNDLYIVDKCNKRKNGTFFPTSYSNGRLAKQQKTYRHFCGQDNGNTFLITDYEVYQVIFQGKQQEQKQS